MWTVTVIWICTWRITAPIQSRINPRPGYRFKWFKEDFDKAGGAQKIIARYAPAKARELLAREGVKLEYIPYNWGLNDQGNRGRNYTRGRLILDKITGGGK